MSLIGMNPINLKSMVKINLSYDSNWKGGKRINKMILCMLKKGCTTMLFICYPKCTTCQKARKWLDEHKWASVQISQAKG